MEIYSLRPNQELMLANIRSHSWLIVLGAMQSGKTLPSAIAGKEMGGRTLVVCPLPAVPNWHKTFKLIDHSDYDVMSYSKMNRQYKDLFHKASIYTHNYSTLIIDEIHEMRSYSLKYQTVRRMVKHFNFKKKIGLTGTLVDKDPSELFYPLSLLTDKYGKSRQTFYDVFCRIVNPGSKYPNYVLRPDIAQEFRNSLAEFCFSYEGEGMVHPEIIEKKYPLMTKQKEKIKALMENEEFPEIDNEHANLELSNRRNKMRQLLSGFYIRNDKSIVRPCVTIKWFTLTTLVSKYSKRVVIWVAYNEEKNLVRRCLRYLNCAEFSHSNLEAFKRDEIDVLICHPRSASMGISMAHAEVAIYVSQVHSAIDMQQSMARLSQYKGEGGKKIYLLVPEEAQYDMFKNTKQKFKTNKRLYEDTDDRKRREGKDQSRL